jgi:hypothetical protein
MPCLRAKRAVNAMSRKIEDMLRLVLMNQIEIMSALNEILDEEPLTEDDHKYRAELRANLAESIEQTLDRLKSASTTEAPDEQEH